MAAPDAAILQEIARISGAINRAKAASQDASSSSSSSLSTTSTGVPAVPTSSMRGRSTYHQPTPYGHRGGHAYRGRGYPPSYPSSGPFRGSHSPQYSQQPYSTRGKPRTHTVTRANNTWTAASAAAPSSSTDVGKGSKHKTLVLNHAGKDKSISPAGTDSLPLPAIASDELAETGALDRSGENSTAIQDTEESIENAPSASASDEANKEEKVTTSKQEEDVDMEDGEIDESTLPPPEPKRPPISLIKQGNEIIINGVTFVSDASGRKLVRKDSSSRLDAKGKGKALLDDNSTTSTPSKTSIDGQAYVRTKSGNLISTAVLKKRQEMAAKKKRINDLVAVAKNVQKARQASARAQRKKTLCRYFQKTGVCARANTCPYIHDSEKVAICPRFLRNSCPLTSSTCPLSHAPNAYRMPHCQHYPYCKRGDSCPYTHIQVSPDAKICKDFVGFGWCEKGDKCPDRHVWECPDFEEKGVCSKRGCKLGHVIRRKTGEENSKSATSQETPSFMFVDTNPDPSYVQDKSISLPDSSRKRSASNSIASAEDYSSGEEEAANLVRKKIKIVPIAKDAMQANEDFVTLVFSDMEGEDDEDEEEESEVESGLEEDHLDSISRRRYPISYHDGNGELNDTNDNENEDSEDGSSDEDATQADTTLRSTCKTAVESDNEENDESDELEDTSESDN